MVNKVYFDQNHWTNPRGTIANVYENNDYGYVFHATSILIDVLEFADLTILDCKNLKVLDYGCGTGRVTRQFALTGAQVVGYDPVVECINESERELEKIGNRYKNPLLLTSSVELINNTFDLIFSVNVIEHLEPADVEIAISNMEEMLNNNGQMIVWIHITKNAEFCKTHNLEFDEKFKGVTVVKGVKENGVITYSPVFRR